MVALGYFLETCTEKSFIPFVSYKDFSFPRYFHATNGLTFVRTKCKQSELVPASLKYRARIPIGLYLSPNVQLAQPSLQIVQNVCGSIYIRTLNPAYTSFSDTFSSKPYRKVEDPVALFRTFRTMIGCENQRVFLATDSSRLKNEIRSIDATVVMFNESITHIQKSDSKNDDGVLLDWYALLFSKNVAGTSSTFLNTAVCFFNRNFVMYEWNAGKIRQRHWCRNT